jgi:hypothetical protein
MALLLPPPRAPMTITTTSSNNDISSKNKHRIPTIQPKCKCHQNQWYHKHAHLNTNTIKYQAAGHYLGRTISDTLDHIGDTSFPLFLHGMKNGKALLSQAAMVHRSASKPFTTWIEVEVDYSLDP